MGLYEVRRAFQEMSEQARHEAAMARRSAEEQLAKRRAKKVLRKRAQLLVAAVDGFEDTLPERDKMLRPGISNVLDARDGLRDALEGKLTESAGG